MGRSQSAAISDTAKANSAQDQANAQLALARTSSSLKDYSSKLKDYTNWGNATFGDTGEFIGTANEQATSAAAGAGAGTRGALALNAMRTGENTANYAPTLAENQRQGARDITDFMAQKDQQRLAALGAIKQYSVDASKFPAQINESIYGTSLGGGNTALGTAQQASAASPGFWDVFGQDVAQGAGAAIGSYAGAKAGKG